MMCLQDPEGGYLDVGCSGHDHQSISSICICGKLSCLHNSVVVVKTYRVHTY